MKHVFMKLGACIAVMVIALLPVMPVISSDVSDADFYGIVQTTNNSTAATGVVTTITGMNMTALMAGGFVNSSANNCAIQSSTGADMPFMPGYGTNPTVMYNGSIGQNTIVNSLFYTKNVTGGKFVWFPGSTGGTIPDTMTEPGSSFNMTLTNCFVDTANGTSKDIISHYDATNGGLQLYVDNTTAGKINLNNTGSPFDLLYTFASSQYCDKAAGVVSPSGADITLEGWVYVSSVGAYRAVVSAGNAVGQLCTRIEIDPTAHIYFEIDTAAGGAYAANWISTPAISTGAWHFITCTYDNTATPKTRVYVDGAEVAGTDTGAGGNIRQPNANLAVGATYVGAGYTDLFNGYIDEVRISSVARTLAEHQAAYNGGNGISFTVDANTTSLWHFNEGAGDPADATTNNNLTRVNNPTWSTNSPVDSWGGLVSLTGISTGEHDIIIGLSGGTFTLNIDGTANTTLSPAIGNSTSNWTMCEGATVLYIESIEYNQGAAKVDLWDWEYNTTFTGDTTGNILTPTFPSAGNDADVSSILVSFQPIAEPTAPAFAVGEGPGFFDSSNLTSGNFTTGNVTLEYPLQDLIEDVASAGGVPYQIPSTFIASFCVIVLSMLTSFFLKRYSAQSIFLKTIVNTAAYGVLIALHIYDWWMLIFFFIFEASIWFGAQHRRE